MTNLILDQFCKYNSISQVDLLLSRDLDSRFTEREIFAVDEWLESGNLLHIMRDNPNHSGAILGKFVMHLSLVHKWHAFFVCEKY